MAANAQHAVDFEDVTGGADDSTSVAPKGWTNVTGGLRVVQYGAKGGFPTPAQGPKEGGKNFLSGGTEETATGDLVLPLSSTLPAATPGTTSVTMTVCMGMLPTQTDTSQIEMRFLPGSDPKATPLDSVGFTSDPSTLIGDAEFSKFTGTRDVPPGTVSIDLHVTMTRRVGSDNDGYLDNILLVVLPA